MVSIALSQFFEEFGVYGEVENDSEDFRWEELENATALRTTLRRRVPLGEPNLLDTILSS